MIIEGLLKPIFFLIGKLFSQFPQIPVTIYNLSGLSFFMSIVNTLLPDGYLATFLTTVLFFKSWGLIWSMIEWLYKKIPGID